MKVSDLKQSEIVPGLRISGLVSGIGGTVILVDDKDDDYAWIIWDNEVATFSGFYGTNCNCEIREDAIPEHIQEIIRDCQIDRRLQKLKGYSLSVLIPKV